MHAIQTLAHRAPPATRTRARWQPYSSIPTPSRPLLLNTPISVSPSPFPVTPSNDALRPTPSIVIAQTPKDTVPKEPIKAKGSFSAVDQAVKALCEIWHPQDIPKAFLPPRGLVTKNEDSKSVLCHTHQAFTSSRQPSTLQHLPPLPLCADSTSTASSTSHDPVCHNPVAIANHLAPMKTFVHEVLRRSRTSGCVLQTALCYLEAIRAKVPQLLQEERAGIRPDTSIPRIIAVEELTDDMASESDSSSVTVDVSPSVNEAIVNTVRIVDQSAEAFSNSEPSLATAINADVNGASLPSPLLCPRRAFLASLILASKFTQDKCYSNRAWAKLSGLPPKEISRCERALGEALDWRLWVGKQSAPAVSAGQRTLSRSQSESCLVIPPSPPLPSEVSKPVSQTTQSGLRRCATLPAEAYASQMPRPLAEIPVPHYVDSLYGSQDHVMAGWDVPAKAMHSSGCLKNSDSCASSPSPSTPSLAYSPSSSESSGGDQTVQMSTYFDEPVQTPAGKTWPWPDRPSEMVLLNGAGLPDLCSKTALDLSSLLVPGGIAGNVNLDVAWYSSEHYISSFSMPTLHTVECS